MLLAPETMQASLKTYRAQRKAGMGQAATKSASPPDIGDQQTFRVYRYNTSDFGNAEFQLRDKTSLYHLWVSVNNLGAVTQAEIDTIRLNMLTQTPAGSIDPTRGVMANNNALFGSPPNVDGDGIVDLLMYDIDNPNVGGFVSPSDLVLDGVANRKDVLHLDVFSSLSFLPQLVAHEYTHLIHFNYKFDADETFIAEGMASYAEVVNGFPKRNPSYLALPTEHKRGLFSWRSSDNADFVRDYQRAQLFFIYLADQVGPQVTASLVQMEGRAGPGIDAVLVHEGLQLSDVIPNFHTANWVFDTSVNPLYGYSQTFSSPPAPVPDFRFETAGVNFTPEGIENPPTIEGGAVHYVYFEQLADLSLNFDAWAAPATIAVIPSILDDFRSRLRARVVATRDDGGIETADVLPSSSGFRLLGNYKNLTLIVTGVDPAKVQQYSIDASWRNFGTGTDVEDPETPLLFSLVEAYPNPLVGQGTVAVDLPRAAPVQVFLVDVLGRRVKTLADAFFVAGRHEIRIDVSGVTSGSYLLVARSAGRQMSQPLAILR
ncbi:MAG: hypothetical protein ACI80V_000445 [Rhodothermales bacterium]|jgi:hypothetical protein